MHQPSIQAAVDAFSRIPDARLLAASRDELTEQAYQILEPLQFEGVVLRVPSNLRAAADGRAPALVVMSQIGRRAVQAPPGDNAVVIVNRLGNAPQHWIAALFPPDPTKFRTTGPAPDPDPTVQQPVEVATVKLTDLRELGVLPWEPGDYVVRVVSYYMRSNSAVLRLLPVTGGQPLGPAPAPPAPGADIVEGATLTVPATGGSRSVPVQGMVRLPAGDVAPGDTRALLLLTRRNVSTPLAFPVHLPLTKAADGRLEGKLVGDLATWAGGSLPADRYAVYLLAGRYTAGPYLLQVD